jgi:hypothetical protein
VMRPTFVDLNTAQVASKSKSGVMRAMSKAKADVFPRAADSVPACGYAIPQAWNES